jgi:hypothetical protein
VHNNIAAGLTLTNVVSGATSGMVLDRVKYVAGSYPPSAVKSVSGATSRGVCSQLLHPPPPASPSPWHRRTEFRLPMGEWPAGMFARGGYKAVTTVTDDDCNRHLHFTWAFEIAKTWPDGT